MSTRDFGLYCIQGTIVSIFSIGALVGTLVSGLLSDLAGRRVTVAVGATTCVLGGVLQSSSFYLWLEIYHFSPMSSSYTYTQVSITYA